MNTIHVQKLPKIFFRGFWYKKCLKRSKLVSWSNFIRRIMLQIIPLCRYGMLKFVWKTLKFYWKDTEIYFILIQICWKFAKIRKIIMIIIFFICIDIVEVFLVPSIQSDENSRCRKPWNCEVKLLLEWWNFQVLSFQVFVTFCESFVNVLQLFLVAAIQNYRK